jgi:hypothetical protein
MVISGTELMYYEDSNSGYEAYPRPDARGVEQVCAQILMNTTRAESCGNFSLVDSEEARWLGPVVH